MDELFTSPNQATNSDFAFWGKHAFSGYYTGDAGSRPAAAPAAGGRCGHALARFDRDR